MLALVDAERFPALTAAVSQMHDGDDDYFTEQFDFGLRVLLDGLEAMISRAQAGLAPTRAASRSANSS
ncbi:Uncharacterised protein [Mycobacteroides abscessus subsp. abscessus]|nr:Uncharacterised protein [Mycobacteroides abscessus subsp. abscessus]